MRFQRLSSPLSRFKKHRFLLAILLAIMSGRNSSAQQDSTLNALHRQLATTTDTMHVKATLDLSWHFMRSRPDSALYFGHLGLLEARRIKFIKGEALSENALGVAYVMQANYGRAVEHNIKSFLFNQKIGNVAYYAAAVNNIGNDYYELGDNNNAIKYLKLALMYSKKYNKPDVAASALITLGNIYNRLKHDQEAMSHYVQGINLAQKNNNVSDVCYGYRSLGKFFADRRRFAKSLTVLRKALKLRENWDDYGKLVDHLSLATTFLAVPSLDSAENHILKAKKIASERNFLLELQEAHSLRRQLFEAKKQPWEALQAFKEYNIIGDSIFSVRKNQAIQANQIEFETAQKEFQLSSLRKEHEWQKKKGVLYIILSLCGALTALLIFWVYNVRNKTLAQEKVALQTKLDNEAERARLDEIRHEQEQQRAELEILKSQLNPHFLFNVLNTISQLTLRDGLKARDCIQQLSKVYRYVLENRAVNLVPLEKELGFAQAYLKLLATRFGEALKVNCSLPENLPWTVPPMVVQMLIENVAKHNIISKNYPLQLKLYIEDGYFCVGNTRRPRVNRPHSFGKGLLTIQTRYHILTDQPVKQEITCETFLVKLPLLEFSEVD